jgi:ElaB/YqjD/DUF883 family membrane-anchored ribosome-binding protein
MQENVQRLMPKIEGVLETSRQTIEDSRKQIAEITSKTSEILETTRQQVHRIDEFLNDAASRARVQMDRAEMVLDDAMVRTQRTVAVVEGGILKPIVQIQGVAAGIKTAITFLLRGDVYLSAVYLGEPRVPSIRLAQHLARAGAPRAHLRAHCPDRVGSRKRNP